MNLKKHVLLLALAFIVFGTQAQEVKIGYTNIELVLAYMPESKQMEQSLESYQKQLAKELQVKEEYLQQRYEYYVKKKEEGSLPSDDQAQKELERLQNEVTAQAKEGDLKLMTRREELLSPILTKLQNAIDHVADELGYTYILNQTTSSGVSTILYGPEDQDVTNDIMKHLGIQIPKE